MKDATTFQLSFFAIAERRNIAMLPPAVCEGVKIVPMDFIKTYWEYHAYILRLSDIAPEGNFLGEIPRRLVFCGGISGGACEPPKEDAQWFPSRYMHP